MTATILGLDALLREVAATAAEVDSGRANVDRHVRAVAASGVFDGELDALLARDPSATDVRGSAGVIADLATRKEERLSDAAWAREVAKLYGSWVGPSPEIEDPPPDEPESF